MADFFYRTICVGSVVLALVGCAREQLPCQANPEFFCNAFVELRAGLPDEELQEIKAYGVGEDHTFISDIGGYARAHLGLWEENEYTEFFQENGVEHPDTMSAFVSDGFVLYLNGQPVDMVAMLAADRARIERLLRLRGAMNKFVCRSNYMFKPTPELTLRLLWLGGRRGLTWR